MHAFHLDRFVVAQHDTYDRALAEIRAGGKRTHWMWFLFPQLAGLGRSALAQEYAISSAAEARAYLEHPILGPPLVECATAAPGVLRHAVRPRVAPGVGVSPAARPVLPGRA